MVKKMLDKVAVKIGMKSAKNAYSAASDNYYFQTQEPEAVRKVFEAEKTGSEIK